MVGSKTETPPAKPRWFRAAVEHLVGHDVFLSYAHADGQSYADELRAELERRSIACFVDRHGGGYGSALKPFLISALRRSSIMVVIATPAAIASTYVALEVAEFAKTGRPIVPLFPAGAEPRLPWNSVRDKELVWIPDDIVGPASKPHPDTIQKIDQALRFRRKRRLATTLILVTAAIVLLLSGGIALVSQWYFGAAQDALRQGELAFVRDEEARREQQRAQAARLAAEGHQRIAAIETLAREAIGGNHPADRRLLLALHAVDLAANEDPRIRDLAEHSLRQSVAHAGGVPLLKPSTGEVLEVQSVASDSDGKCLAIAVGEATGPRRRWVDVYATSTPMSGPIYRLTSPFHDAENERSILNDLQTLAVSVNCTRVFAANDHAPRSFLWTRDGNKMNRQDLKLPGYAQFVGDGRWLVAQGTVFDVSTTPPAKLAKALWVSPDRRWMADMGDGTVLTLQRIAHGSEASLALRIEGRPWPADPYNPRVTPDAASLPAAAQSQRLDDLLAISDVGFSADSRWMLTIRNSVKAFLTDLHSKAFARFDIEEPLPADEAPLLHNERFEIYGFSRDSRFVVLGGRGKPGRVYDIAGTRPRQVSVGSRSILAPFDSTGRSAAGVSAMAISPDSKWLAMSGYDIYLWRLDRVGQEPIVLRGNREQPIVSLVFSADGRFLASGGATSRLWDLSRPDIAAAPLTLTNPGFGGSEFMFSPDSRWLLCNESVEGRARASESPAIYRAWPLAKTDLAEVARHLAKRSLTNAELDAVLATSTTKSGGSGQAK